MIDKKTASRLYAMNQMGMGSGGPKRPKKRDGEKGQDMSCSEHGCSAYDSGGGGSNVGKVSYKGGSASGGSSTGGEANKVLTKKQAQRRATSFEKARAKAPQMRNLTKKQKEAQSEMRPSRQDVSAPKAKKTKKINF